MRPPRADIAAPELPGRLRWLNAERAPVIAELTAAGPVLVHFLDYAQLNSVRALPYVLEWHRRYAAAGLAVLAVHSPRFAFTRERAGLEAAAERLGIEHPLAEDSAYAVWHDYGCEGWPALFLWGQGGALRWFHFGEGEYEASELAIQAELRALKPDAELPSPLPPRRPTDAPGALVATPSAEVLPGGSLAEPWRGGGEPLRLSYAAGGAHASVAGSGELRVAVDGEERTIAVEEPGLVDLAEHPRHSEHALVLAASEGVEVWSVSFSAGLPG